MSNADLGLLRVNRIIFHHVPKRYASEDKEFRLSQRESDLDDNLRDFFEDRIRISLLNSALGVVFDPTMESPVPDLVLKQLSDQVDDLVGLSQVFARRLYKSQDGSNPAGILAVILGRVEHVKSLVVLKMEPQHGLTLEEIEREGFASFDIHEVENLMLTNRTRVYKAGAFFQHGADLASIEGLVVDLQAGKNTHDVAGFFRKGFLGCAYLGAPDIVTRDLFTALQVFINDEVKDKELQTRYLFATFAEFNRRANEIDPFRLAEEHFVGKDRQALRTFLSDRGIPDRPIPKDVSLIKNQLKRAQWTFKSGLSLVGSPDDFEQYVRSREDDGQEVTEIRDERVRVNAK